MHCELTYNLLELLTLLCLSSQLPLLYVMPILTFCAVRPTLWQVCLRNGMAPLTLNKIKRSSFSVTNYIALTHTVDCLILQKRYCFSVFGQPHFNLAG